MFFLIILFVFSLRIFGYTESGIFVALLQRLRMNYLVSFNKENRIFFTINEFIEDMAGFDNLSIGNFRVIFAFFFSICLAILSVFIGHLIGTKWMIHQKRRKRMRRLRRDRSHDVPIFKRLFCHVSAQCTKVARMHR